MHLEEKHRKVILPVVLAAIVLVGMVMTFVPSMYHYDIVFEESDGQVTVSFDSNVGVQTNTVVLTNSGLYDIRYVAAYVDESYASLNDWELQREMFCDMEFHLDIRGVDGFGIYDAESLLAFMESADPSSTALFFASGSLPDVIYDGTSSCPLIRWLGDGGIVVNMSGVLGKYVSSGPELSDITEVDGFASLFGLEDDDIRPSTSPAVASAGCNEAVRDALHFYMDECTYGIDVSEQPDALNLGYYSADGYSSACVFKSQRGMVFNFAVSMSTHEHSDHYVAQILASGLDYTSEILDSQTGNTRGDSTTVVDVTEGCSVYAFFGSTRAEYGERFTVS